MTEIESEMTPMIIATMVELLEVKLSYKSTTVEELIIDFAFDQKISLQFSQEQGSSLGCWEFKTDSFILPKNWMPHTFFYFLGTRKLHQLHELAGTKDDGANDHKLLSWYASLICMFFQPNTAPDKIDKHTTLEYFESMTISGN